MSVVDVIVVGNGAIGHATARALTIADPTLRVAVVGRSVRPLGASTAAGAMLGCFGEVTDRLLRSQSGRTKLQHGIQAKSLWPRWIDSMNAELDEEQQLSIVPGTYVINNPKSGGIEDDNYAAIRKAAHEYDEPVVDVDPRTIPGLWPNDDCRASRAMYLPEEGSIDSGRLLAAYDTLASRNPHLTLIADHARALTIAGGTLRGIELESMGTLEAKHVVLAAGIATQRLVDQLPDLASRIPRLFPGGGNAVVLDTDVPVCPSVIRTSNRAFACGFHVVPRGRAHIYVGATNHISMRPFESANVSDMFFLLECLMEQVHPGHQADRLVSWKAGNRPVSIDGCPLVGGTSVDGLWIMTGTYRDGLYLSPLLAQEMASWILGTKATCDCAFPPERRPINTMSREEATEEALKHFLAVGWEHGIKIPKVGWHTQYERMYRQLIVSVYDALESEFVLPPEFLPVVDGDRARMIPFFREYYAGVTRAWSGMASIESGWSAGSPAL